MLLEQYLAETRASYANYLKDKKVCLVGPAPTIKEIKQSNLIDCYDVVVRMNRALPIHPNLIEFTGNRTDVLYNCMSEDPESGGFMDVDYLKDKIQWVVSAVPASGRFTYDVYRFASRNNRVINFTSVDEKFFASLEKTMNTRPNTGMLAIMDLLSYDISELYITGITFFKGGYTKEYREYNEEQVMARMNAHGNHKQEPQIDLMKSVYSSDKRIVVDKFLKEILQ